MTAQKPAKAETPAPEETPAATPAAPESTTPDAPEVEGEPTGTESDLEAGTAPDTTTKGPNDEPEGDELDPNAGDETDEDGDDDTDESDGDDIDTTQDRYRLIVLHDRAVPGYLPQGASHTFELFAKDEKDAERQVMKKGGLLAESWPDTGSTEDDRKKKSHKGHDGEWEVASVAKIY